jgi:hypothetical protein
VASGYWLTVRTEGKVRRARFATLDEAVAELEREGTAFVAGVDRETIDLKVREFSPAAQVAARLEVSGPGRFLPAHRGGVDVRGDGSAEAYVGGVRRRLVEAKRSESPYDALRRALED